MSFKRFDPEDLVLSADSITGTCWSNNIPTLTNFHSSSTQQTSNTGLYYLETYQTQSGLASAAVQFDIAYGDKLGSGSALFNSQVSESSPSKVIYGQYRTLVLGDENSDFIFGEYTSSYFYVLSIERSRYKETIFPGSMNLKLSGSLGNTIYLTDNSVNTPVTQFNDAGRVYQVVSGSNGSAYSGSGYTANSGSYGLFLPDIGTILLNGEALDGIAADGGISLGTLRNPDTPDFNPRKLYAAISGSGLNPGSFGLNSQETLTSDYVFVRARNAEFNYSENPSYISGSSGDIIYPLFINSPQSYITSVGLYNDMNELCAVAKLSRPLLKDFTKELLVRVKLDF